MQRPLAVVFGLGLVVAGLAVGSQGDVGGIGSMSRWLVFGLLLAGVLALTWTPSSPKLPVRDDDAEASDRQDGATVHYTRSGG